MPSLYVVLERDLGLDSPDFREIQTEWFDQFAQQAGASLWDFFGQDPGEFLGEDELQGIEGGEKWFAAAEGLKTLQTLLTALQADSSARATRARKDLQALESILGAANSASVRFYLALDI